MAWIDEQPSELLKHWLCHTTCPMLATLPDGTILWANQHFEQLLDYTYVELTRLTWKQLTVEHTDLEADERMAAELVAGLRQSYQLQKSYRKKGGAPCRVMIHVMRYPIIGDFQVFLVSVVPLDHGYAHAMEMLNDMRQQLMEVLTHIRTPSPSLVDRVWEWAKENPWKFGIVASVTLGFLFGDRFLDVLHRVSDIMRGMPFEPPKP